jgi:type I restriction enzyme S subunit
MPNNWKTYKLGDLISYQKGFAFKSDWFKEKGDLVVRVSDTTSNSIDISSCHRIDKEKAITLQRYKLEKDDIVIATVGSWPPNYASVVGKVVKVPKEANGALLNQNAVRLKSVDDSLHSKKYIYYLMKSDSFLRYIVNTAQGSANQASIKLTDIFDFKFDIPSLQEQQSIASILSAIDDKIENNLAINKTLEEMAMALYKHWFVDFGPFQDGEFVESELGMIPKGWEVKRVKDFGEIVCGKTPSKKDENNYSTNGFPFIKIPDMHNNVWVLKTSEGISEKGNKTQLKKLLPTGSINVSCIATVGLVSINCLPSHTNQQINSIIPNNLNTRNYLYLTMLELKETFLNEASGGSATLNMNTSTFSNIKLLKPKEDVLNEFHFLVNNYFEHIKENQLENLTLTQLRDTLLPQLISGAVRLKEFRE